LRRRARIDREKSSFSLRVHIRFSVFLRLTLSFRSSQCFVCHASTPTTIEKKERKLRRRDGEVEERRTVITEVRILVEDLAAAVASAVALREIMGKFAKQTMGKVKIRTSWSRAKRLITRCWISSAT
jgi:hypothetical protein